MKIDVTYANGVFASFDTATLVSSDPFRDEGKNIVTEYRLRTDIFPEAGLVLDIMWHDAGADTGKTELTNEINGGSIATALRHIGRRVVLVEPSRANGIAKVVMGTQTVLWKQAGEWANALKLDAKLLDMGLAPEVTASNEQALTAYQMLTTKAIQPAERAAAALGYSRLLLEKLEAESAQVSDDLELMENAGTEPDENQEGGPTEEDLEGSFDEEDCNDEKYITDIGILLGEGE